MNPDKDAYGQAMFAYLNDKSVREIIERDNGDEYYSGGPEIYFAEFNQWLACEQEAIKYAKEKVLDVGCGAGRNVLYLQNMGMDVTGIDTSPLAVKVCKTRGIKDARIMSIQNINKFGKNAFDTILLMGCNFGLLENFEKAANHLKNIYDITSENAIIIASSSNPYMSQNEDFIAYQKSNLERGRRAGEATIRIKFKDCISDWADYVYVSPEEMAAIAKEEGWTMSKTISRGANTYVGILKKEPLKNYL